MATQDTDIQDAGALQTIKDYFAEQMQNKIDRDRMILEAQLEYGPSVGQMANFGGMLLPGAGIADAAGKYSSMGPKDQPFLESFSNEPYPSIAENLKRGGFGGYTDAFLQGLGVLGDATYGIPIIGAAVGPIIGTPLKAAGAAGKAAKAAVKGIAALDRTKQALRADVEKFAKDDLGFTSPTIQALIERAPPNLKGPQITEWAKANANKGVKPKELEFLGLDEFVAANPNATTREAVEGISGNKVRVSQNIYSGGDADLEFDVHLPDLDPLDGTPLHQFETDNLLDSINSGDEFEIEGIISIFNQSNPQVKAKTIDEIDNFLTSKGEDFEDFIDNIGKLRYDDNPFEMITPKADQLGNATELGYGTFAIGNEDFGYSLFVDGNRVTNNNNIAYSQAEAQIQLREALGFDEFSYGGGTRFKTYVDESLPGGSNYREVVFNWDNAPVQHNIGHFDEDPTQIAHALIRDRVLDDGTPSLHIDELQSDLHTEGSKKGYKPPQAEVRKAENEISELLDGISDNADISSFTTARYGGYSYKTNVSSRLNAVAVTSLDANAPPKILNENDIRSVNNMIEGLKKQNGEIAYKPKELLKKLKAEEIKKKEDILITDPQAIASGAMTKPNMYGSKEADMLVEALGKDIHKLNNLFEPIRADISGVPNYPYKKDWYDMGLKKLLLQAAEEGKPALSISGSAPMKARYSEQYHKFYEMLYDKKIPSAMKKLANKYGGKFEKEGSLDLVDTFGSRGYIENTPSYETQEIANATANIIYITPEMRERILEEGIQAFGTGGIVDSGIAHLKRDLVRKMAKQLAKQGHYRNQTTKAQLAAFDKLRPTPAQAAYISAQFAPSAGVTDAAGGMASFPTSEAVLQDAFAGEPMPSFAENIGAGNYFDAGLQGLGVLGDSMYAVPIAGGVLGPTVGSLLKGAGAAGKLTKRGIASLTRNKKARTPLEDYVASQQPRKKLKNKPKEHPVRQLRSQITKKRDERARGVFSKPTAGRDIDQRLAYFKEEKRAKNRANKRIDNIINNPNSQYWYKPDKEQILKNVEGAVERANLKGLVRKMKKEGWLVDYVSKNEGKVASYYMKKGSNTLRVSDHDLPMTAQREHNRSMGLSGLWDGEIVVDSKTNIEQEYKSILDAIAPLKRDSATKYDKGGEVTDENVQRFKEALKKEGINKLYETADSLGFRLPSGIGVDSAADVITNELLFRAKIPLQKRGDAFTLRKKLPKGINLALDFNPKQKSAFLNFSGAFKAGGEVNSVGIGRLSR